MNLLVSGCAGYIGSTFCYEALKRGYGVIGVDNFINGKKQNIFALSSNFVEKFSFIEEDLSNYTSIKLENFLKDKEIDAAVHFAGLKAVGESEDKPIVFWRNNLDSSINLVKILSKNSIKKIIFSSSATVYGDTTCQPINESNKIQPTSTYGSTKIAIEQLLMDCARAKILDAVSLRYFNPVGSHQERDIYENPFDMPNNLMPRIIRVALGLDKKLQIFGNDYDTRDGTGERDFIHIGDLIEGHFKALEYIKINEGFEAFNLGTGKGVTVSEIISCFEAVNKIKIPYEYSERRHGDIARCFADPSKAEKLLGWSAEKDLEDMCIDSWEAVRDM